MYQYVTDIFGRNLFPLNLSSSYAPTLPLIGSFFPQGAQALFPAAHAAVPQPPTAWPFMPQPMTVDPRLLGPHVVSIDPRWTTASWTLQNVVIDPRTGLPAATQIDPRFLQQPGLLPALQNQPCFQQQLLQNAYLRPAYVPATITQGVLPGSINATPVVVPQQAVTS
ncbi:MAG: hypothetical protein HYY16_14680 [Planctomycetes bacterium]|nr:hypothetical protein [Planctomycetota bacterium]